MGERIKEGDCDWNEYSDVWKNSVDDNSLVCYDVEKGEGFGVVYVSEGWIQVTWCKDMKKEVMGVDSRMRVRVNDEGDWEESGQDGVGCVDLDSDGRRWEGGVKDGKPFGYGVLYDDEGRKEFEGFMMEEVKVCYGVEYYSDIGSLKYMGSYWNDTRCGRGILYDRQGSIEYEGLWRDDKPLASVSTSISITSETESVEIPKKSFHHPQSFVLPHYLHSLKRLVIRYKCFIQVRFFELNRLPELESVAVGKKSFFIPFDRPTPGRFRVANCPKLEVIRIGHDSFHSFDSFGLVNLPSLRTLEFGWRCFTDVSSFSLAGWWLESNEKQISRACRTSASADTRSKTANRLC